MKKVTFGQQVAVYMRCVASKRPSKQQIKFNLLTKSNLGKLIASLMFTPMNSSK